MSLFDNDKYFLNTATVLLILLSIWLNIVLSIQIDEKNRTISEMHAENKKTLCDIKLQAINLQKSIDTLNIKIGFVKTINHIRIVDSE